MQEKITVNSIPAAAADKLISAHDGDAALLYIYRLRTGCEDLEQAAHDLCRTLREITDADEKLRRMELIPSAAHTQAALSKAGAPRPAPAAPGRSAAYEAKPYDEKPAAPAMPAEELPQYRSEDIVRRSKTDGMFSVILDEAAKVTGRPLNSNDMKVLFGIYDYLALPAEVIMELLNYCAELFTEKYGTGRRPSARAIEKEAYAWANREILTLEQAEEYIHFQKQRRGELGRLKAAVGIHGRELTATEAKYLASWLDMGFGAEAASIAYDRTVTNTGSLKWPYMNKILTRWHENGLHTPQEIEAKDGRSRPAPQPVRSGEKAIDMDKLRKALDNI